MMILSINKIFLKSIQKIIGNMILLWNDTNIVFNIVV